MRFLTDRLIEQRDKQDLMHVEPHLHGGEEVIGWVRAQHPEEQRQGYAYLTSRRMLVIWSSHADGHGAIAWTDIHSWGVDDKAPGGPILGVEAAQQRVFVHIPVASRSTARRATHFLRKFARLAPKPRRRLAHGRYAALDPDPAVIVTPARRSAGAQTRRVLIAVLGILLVAGGIVIAPIPGPWSLPLVLAGLAALASEFDWARDVSDWVKDKSRRAREKLRSRRSPQGE